MAVQIVRRLLSVDDYDKMIAAGILREDERLELLGGEIRVMSPIGASHAAIVNRMTQRLYQLLGDSVIISVQNPIRLDDYSEPQPDIAVLRPQADFYVKSLPTPDDVLILMEISDSTLVYDRSEKLSRYAAANIPEVWLIDVNGQAIEQYVAPQAGTFTIQRTIKHDETIISTIIPTLLLALLEFFG